MAKIYVGQDFRLRLATTTDISTATCVIKYLKPAGASGSWAGTVASTAATVVYYDVTAGFTLGQDGFWTVWAHAVFSDGTIGIGEPVRLTMYEEGII